MVLGGPEVSWLSEEAEIFRYADYAIRGEGEESFRSLCRELLCGSKPGNKLDARDTGTIFINQGSTSVDVKNIAPAYRLYTDEDLQRKFVYVEASRGCAFGCEFCQGPVRRTGGPQAVREFPLEAFLAEMETMICRGARAFKFLDRTFNLDTERAARIMGFFLERINALGAGPGKGRLGGRPLSVHFEMVPSRFPPALRELLRRFPPGTLRLEIGIQTFNSETAALIHLSKNLDKELEALEFLRRETNALLHVDLIAGLPGEDLASFGAGFDLLWHTLSGGAFPAEKACEIQLGILKCLPGTPIARHNETHGMRYSVEPPYEVMETGALSAAELGRIKN